MAREMYMGQGRGLGPMPHVDLAARARTLRITGRREVHNKQVCGPSDMPHVNLANRGRAHRPE
ncbi:hypothetical protein GCM10023201_36400 [Actinomycetospora corticicola]|uniref:Uncharacterized protein n=1 Tax=Actinomycetospora corticicola TaxID=663602 RepID=A0A7Y9J798_9PSEU|nr:hypothetical protein [Actinomycetospora corticicola]